MEFGLVFPLVMLMIFGIIQYGYLFWSLQTASATARETARLLIVGSDWTCAKTYGESFADGPAVGTAPVVVDRAYHAVDGTAQSAPAVGSMVTVTVTFQSLDLAILPVPDAGMVTQRATARIENVPPRRLKCDDSQDFVAGAGAF